MPLSPDWTTEEITFHHVTRRLPGNASQCPPGFYASVLTDAGKRSLSGPYHSQRTAAAAAAENRRKAAAAAADNRKGAAAAAESSTHFWKHSRSPPSSATDGDSLRQLQLPWARDRTQGTPLKAARFAAGSPKDPAPGPRLGKASDDATPMTSTPTPRGCSLAGYGFSALTTPVKVHCRPPARGEDPEEVEQPDEAERPSSRAKRNTQGTYAGKRCPKTAGKKDRHLQDRETWYASRRSARTVSRRSHMYSETAYNAFMRDAMARLAQEGVKGNACMRMAADMWSRAGGKLAEEVEEQQPADEEKQLQAERPSGRAKRNTQGTYAGKRCPKSEGLKQEHHQKRDAWYAVQGTARMFSQKTSKLPYSGTQYNAFLKATMTQLAKEGVHGPARMKMAAKLWRATKT